MENFKQWNEWCKKAHIFLRFFFYNKWNKWFTTDILSLTAIKQLVVTRGTFIWNDKKSYDLIGRIRGRDVVTVYDKIPVSSNPKTMLIEGSSPEIGVDQASFGSWVPSPVHICTLTIYSSIICSFIDPDRHWWKCISLMAKCHNINFELTVRV